MEPAEKLLEFIEKCPTAFHAIAQIRARLLAEGYEELAEGRAWKIAPGGSYFTVRNESSLIAFRLPQAEASGFMIAASHSDSPAFKIKEAPEMVMAGAYTCLNVEKYGGMLMNPWFDRPLSVAGRLIIRDGSSFSTKPVNADRDLLMIPSLAIHMNRCANEGVKLNPQKDLIPVLGDETAKGSFLDLIAREAGVDKDQIAGSDLFLYSRSKGCIWGAGREYISSGRLDDLQCTFADLEGFIASGREEGSSASIPLLAVFDNEEVGSGTKQGADSTFLSDVLVRIGQALGLSSEGIREKIASSFMVSADNAHAVHPNAADKADPVNRPLMNKGIVIKFNANQKYTTDALSQALFKEILRRADVPWQNFTNRSDMAGGSTLGNISAAHVSVNTVDIGLPQLAMHSPYETAGVRDTEYLIRAMEVFFRSQLEEKAPGVYILRS